jgi:mRNA interferase RelE/StbE
LVWKVEIAAPAQKSLRNLGKVEADRITQAMLEIAALGDPRLRGHILVGGLAGLWRYRVGDWRVVCRIEDERLVVLVVTIGHRREIYR